MHMSTSTLLALLTNASSTGAIDYFWSYFTAVTPTLVLFAVAIAVVSLAIYFVLKHLRVVG